MQHHIKSAVAQKYYETLNLSYDTEAARKKFNQDWTDLNRLIEVLEATCREDEEQIKHLKDDEGI